MYFYIITETNQIRNFMNKKNRISHLSMICPFEEGAIKLQDVIIDLLVNKEVVPFLINFSKKCAAFLQEKTDPFSMRYLNTSSALLEICLFSLNLSFNGVQSTFSTQAKTSPTYDLQGLAFMCLLYSFNVQAIFFTEILFENRKLIQHGNKMHLIFHEVQTSTSTIY